MKTVTSRTATSVLLVLFLSLLTTACRAAGDVPGIHLDLIELPPGFRIDLYARDVPNARSLAMSPNGVLFVGTRSAGNVYAILDKNQDQIADEVIKIADGLNMPNGVAFRDGALFVAEVDRIQFPAQFHHQIFIAEHGSWNRSVPIGYRITLVNLAKSRAVKYEVFAKGWLQGNRAWGRPVDILVMDNGAMLVSDDRAGVIYRISYRR